MIIDVTDPANPVETALIPAPVPRGPGANGAHVLGFRSERGPQGKVYLTRNIQGEVLAQGMKSGT